ncbi:hypothetical protein BB560_000330 [Smittium megazygosporum]|uniref:SET domain-containing protein n=1 Tax=Smittium megazygosporum TaxID=133381 RepID=A0A2T9ZKR8_9FUNG|nr:hypothetical protein BB560_000330 [Smittium megazygosporum]
MESVSPEHTLQNLLLWFAQNEITYDDSNISVVVQKSDPTFAPLVRYLTKSGLLPVNDPFARSLADTSIFDYKYAFGVLAKKNIPEEKIVVRIPKTAVISAKNSPLANLFEDENISGELALCITLIFEASLGKSSAYWGYLQSLPHSIDTPLLWQSDSQEYLVGTEAGRLLSLDLEKLSRQFETFLYLVNKYPYVFNSEKISKLLSPSGSDFLPLNRPNAFSGFLHFFGLVTSRAFHVDDYLGNCMVPFADLFNHKSGNEDVHVFCDTDVCLFCGELYGCEHKSSDDAPNSSDVSSIKSKAKETDSESEYMSEDISENDEEEWDDESDYSSEESELDGEEMPLLVGVKSDSNTNKTFNNGRNTLPTLKTSEHPSFDSVSGKYSEVSKDMGFENDDQPEVDIVEIITEKPVKKGRELFNTYGMHSSGYFLHRYGFVDTANFKYETVWIDPILVIKLAKSELFSDQRIADFFGFTFPLFNEISKHQIDLFDGYFDDFKEELNNLFESIYNEKKYKLLAKPNTSETKKSNLNDPDHFCDDDGISSNRVDTTPNSGMDTLSLKNSPDSIISKFDTFLFLANGHPSISFLVFLTFLSSDKSVIEFMINSLKDDFQIVYEQFIRLSMFWTIWSNSIDSKKKPHNSKDALEFANLQISRMYNEDVKRQNYSKQKNTLPKNSISGNSLNTKAALKSGKGLEFTSSLAQEKPQTTTLSAKKRKASNPKNTSKNSDKTLSLNTLYKVCLLVSEISGFRHSLLKKNKNFQSMPKKDDNIAILRWLSAASIYNSESILLSRISKKYKQAANDLGSV